VECQRPPFLFQATKEFAAMSTQQQIEANRLNAQHSTGPQSPAGKHSSSGNALRHGLSAVSIQHFPAASREEYAAFRAALEADMRPGSALESVYFEQFAFSQFMAQRAQALEASAVEKLLADPADEAANRQFRSASRYYRAHTQSANKALALFRELQADRYHAVVVQDKITHEFNSNVTVPVSAPLSRLMHTKSRTYSLPETAVSIVYAEAARTGRPVRETKRNEPNPIAE
jgi:hypothetical protein